MTDTRLFDRVHIETVWKWYANQHEKASNGAPRNTEKYREASDELLQLADAIMKLEAGVKKGDIPHLHKTYVDLYAPKPKVSNVRQITSGKAPTSKI